MHGESFRGLSKLEKGLMAICVLLGILSLLLFLLRIENDIRLSIVAGQVSILVDMEEASRESGVPKDIATSAVKAAEMFPAAAASSTDIILSLVASNAISDMCSSLRQLTGTNIGDNPTEWMKYLSQEAQHGSKSGGPP
jgi:hypothetical protein